MKSFLKFLFAALLGGVLLFNLSLNDDGLENNVDLQSLTAVAHASGEGGGGTSGIRYGYLSNNGYYYCHCTVAGNKCRCYF